MKVKKTALAAGIWVALLFTACAGGDRIREWDSNIYCLNESATGLVKVAYDLPAGDTQEKAQAVLEQLSMPAEDIEYLRRVPEDVKVQ